LTSDDAPAAVAAVSEPAGLYIHVPFCRAICPYCDFAVSLGDEEKRAAYVEALLSEVELVASGGGASAGSEGAANGIAGTVAETFPLGFDTVYFGGGSPSALRPAEIDRMVSKLRDSLPVRGDAKLFLEANPEDVDRSVITEWHDLGVRFLSLGVQSFDSDRLAFLGRGHDGGDARRAVAEAQAAGFDTVSLDLIFGLPDDDATAWDRDLEMVAELEADHVSCYQLTVYQGTAFGQRAARGDLVELDEDTQGARYARTIERLAAVGIEPYEVSNFARSFEHQSAHNRKYWRHVPYLGVGPSAHSFDGKKRWWNRRGVAAWSRSVAAGERPIEGSEVLELRDLILERLMLGLRTRAGLDLARFASDFGAAAAEVVAATAGGAVERGLLERRDAQLRPTFRGLAVADGVVRHLFAEVERTAVLAASDSRVLR